MKNLAIILKDFCKEQYQKYLTKVRLEQEEKTWQNKKATTIDLLNIWLVYLDKQKNLKIYRGLNPDVHEQRREAGCRRGGSSDRKRAKVDRPGNRGLGMRNLP